MKSFNFEIRDKSIKLFKNVIPLTGTHDYYKSFDLLLDVIWAVLHTDDKKYLELVENGSNLEKKLSEIFALMIMEYCYEENFQDILGSIYQEFCYKKGAGQYFTPQNVSDMMAQMIHGDEISKPLPTDRKLKILDPCCGSGVMLLSFKKVVAHHHGVLAINNFEYYGIDIDITCVKMCRIQMLMSDPDYMKWFLLYWMSLMRQRQGLGSKEEVIKMKGFKPFVKNNVSVKNSENRKGFKPFKGNIIL